MSLTQQRPMHPTERMPGYGATSSDSRSVPPQPPAPEPPEPEMPPIRELLPVLIAVWVPVFVGALDTTIVATLQSSIASGFHRSELSAWLGTSFFLATCSSTPLYGRFCDPALLGRRRTLLLATSLFATATTLCGLAPTMWALIAARFLAGMGAAGLSVCSSVIMSDRVPLKNRGILQGALNILWGLGSGLGGPVGGWMNDHAGWRNAFLLQMPLLLICLGLVVSSVHDHHAPPVAAHPEEDPHPPSFIQRLGQIDFLGALTLLVGLSATIVALSVLSTEDDATSSRLVWSGLVVGPTALALFFRIERHAVRPILPLRLLHSRTPLSHAITMFFISGCALSFLYVTPLFFQAVRFQSASMAGQHLSPYSLGVAISSLSTGFFIRRTGKYYPVSLCMNLFMILSPLAFAFAVLMPQLPDWCFYLLVLPQGLGGVSVMTASLIALLNAVDRSDVALATGLSYLFRNAGQAVVVSGSGILLQSILAAQLRKTVQGPGSKELISQIRHETALIPHLPSPLREEVVAEYAQSLHVVYLVLVAAGLAAFVANAGMEHKPLPGFDPKSDEEEDSA